MTQLAGSLPTAALDALDQFVPTTHQHQPAPQKPDSDIGVRILEAYDVAQVYASQLPDIEFRKKVEAKLIRSNVRGSLVVGVRGFEDVTHMLSSAMDWKPVIANLTDKTIEVYQGTLPDAYPAFAAYASLREIDRAFGSPGLGSIQAKKGYQIEDDYYFCTMLRFPTKAITVQLKKDGNQEYLHQWFAGVEVSARGHFNDGDTIVRCGVVIPLLAEQQQKRGHYNDRQSGRTGRPQ